MEANREGERVKRAKRSRTGLGLIGAALVLLAGCAGVGGAPRLVAEEAAAVQASPPTAPVSVTRLTGGQEGFVITEAARLDAAARRDFERAVALLAAGSDAEAIPLLEEVIARSPEITAPHINLAIACARSGRAKEAEEHLKTALRLVPGHPVASNEYGLLLRQGGRFAEARSVYEGALALFPEYLPARRNLGILCDIYLNDLACALEHYKVYSEAVPDDASAKLWVADLKRRLGQE